MVVQAVVLRTGPSVCRASTHTAVRNYIVAMVFMSMRGRATPSPPSCARTVLDPLSRLRGAGSETRAKARGAAGTYLGYLGADPYTHTRE